jgi:hypothetical protein
MDRIKDWTVRDKYRQILDQQLDSKSSQNNNDIEENGWTLNRVSTKLPRKPWGYTTKKEEWLVWSRLPNSPGYKKRSKKENATKRDKS